MTSEKNPDKILSQSKKTFLYRLSQLVAFLVGARIFVVFVLAFALYVSTFFLFNQEESLRRFVFDFKVHGIILCCLLSILAGGIINQFYDREKDQITRPFRTKIQSFLNQKYFLYAYLILSIFSLGIAALISVRVFLFLLAYQFLIWLYSHKISKVLVLNNFTFVSLTLYPFFGMLVYYKTFSTPIFLMAVFLFIILFIIDILKDTLTKNADRIFGYHTLPNYFGMQVSTKILIILQLCAFAISMLLISRTHLDHLMSYYFAAGMFVIIFCLYKTFDTVRSSNFFILNIYRLWIFFGIVTMLLEGFFSKF